jgi:dGTPase
MSNFYTDFDTERFIQENAKHSNRSDFDRDKARLIYSQSVNRLQFKTQIFVSGEIDNAKTRLTHSMEVAQIARHIASSLGLDPDLLECAALAHDIGHPPFGHTGEAVLNDIAKDIGGFEANAQTFRLLTRLEPKVFANNRRSVGLNLTRASLDAILKYPWGYYEASDHTTDSNSIKFNYFEEDAEIFNWVRLEAPDFTKSIECQVMDISDDISYSVHDFEDGIRQFLITSEVLADSQNIDKILEHCLNNYNHNYSLEDLVQAFEGLKTSGYFAINYNGSIESEAKLMNITSSITGEFVNSICNLTKQVYGDENRTRYNATVIVPDDVKAKILILKSIETLFIMQSEIIVNDRKSQESTIKQIVSHIMSNPSNPKDLSPIFIDDWNKANNDSERLRIAIDHTASLTDASAQKLLYLVG